MTKVNVKQWYSLYPVDDPKYMLDLAKELIAEEDGAELQVRRHTFLYTNISWDTLREEFEDVAIVGVDHTKGGTEEI